MKIVEKSFTLLPPAPGVCQECATEHGRAATWADAVAHCEPAVRQAWETEPPAARAPERFEGPA